jgi:hypothetical protein
MGGQRVLATIALDRRFIEWGEGELSDPELIHRFRRPTDLLNWETIVQRRRVVILAEAGSGKTTEMKQQVWLRQEAGQFAVYATVEDVGTDSLDNALGREDRERLASWRVSGEEGWFFVDSVDEAKLHGVRLERVIRRIADGIAGCQRKAHIILSGRLTDWEFRGDLQHLNAGLAIPKDPSLPPPPTADELLISTVRRERRKEPPPPAEEALVVLMAPLDAPRVRLFAAEKGMPRLDEFLAQIEAANLWRFARRPLDLDWLVDYWQTHRRLGSLSEMLEHSLAERVRERNPDRSRGDSLDAMRALHAIERVGAALVFGRKDTIMIPDSDVALSDSKRPLDLAQVLSDWPPDDRTRLLARPVFDPATLGRARLHNDNEGVVRGYLAARWLHRLGQTNLSRGQLFDLLFATTYGIELVKPSVQETAAWLAIWDEEVGREVSRRDPALLLTAGDPASLATSVREAVLTDVVERLAKARQRQRPLDRDSVQRFARPDLGNTVRSLWSKYHMHSEPRDLLLRIIWLGVLKDCADLAVSCAFGAYPDRHTRIVAGRALAVVGDDAAKHLYVEYIKEHCAALPSVLVWDAMDGLFPQFLNVDTLLNILDAIDVADGDGGLGLEWLGPRLAERLDDRRDLERLLRGLLDQLGNGPLGIGHIPDNREQAYFAAIAATAGALLDKCALDEAPTDTVDAALELGARRRYGISIHDTRNIAAELHRSRARRRITFWRAADRLTGHPLLQGRAVQSPFDLEMLGYSPKLQAEDLGWLLADAPQRVTESERRLAVSAALGIWREAGNAGDILSRIEAVARADPAMLSIFEFWVNPPPRSRELEAQEQEFAAMAKEAEEQRAARDRSWLEFVESLRRDPDQLRRLRPISKEGVDARLYHLWQLLRDTVDASTRYAIDSVAPLEPVIGEAAAAALRDALIEHWRNWQPRLKSSRAATERNQSNSLDCMGITGVSLESKIRPHWAERLSADDACRAASYATLEINGFPTWLADLAVVRPAEVRSILGGEVGAELDDPEPRTRYEILEDISHADRSIGKLMAPALFLELQTRQGLTLSALAPMLGIVAQGLGQDRQQFADWAIERFHHADDVRAGALYLGAAFAVDAAAATAALVARLNALEPSAQKSLVEHVLPTIFGDGFRSGTVPPDLDFASLERLVAVAFRTIRAEDDHRRQSGVAFAPDERDNAELARGAAFNQLMQTPGRATYDALIRLIDDPNCPVSKERLYGLAHERAALDAESGHWRASDVLEFEQTAETAPSTPKDLQQVAMRRLVDVQHDLLNADFAQGATVKSLPDENAVQNWIADRLRLKQGRSYSVEREPHVVDEKEPDVHLRAKASDASLAVEIKIPESWTIEQLETALVDQLCGRYLRARESRHGILLLVHQKSHRWRDMETGKLVTFAAVVCRLQARATNLAGRTPDAPQPEIAVIDVSGVVGKTGTRRRIRQHRVRTRN